MLWSNSHVCCDKLTMVQLLFQPLHGLKPGSKDWAEAIRDHSALEKLIVWRGGPIIVGASLQRNLHWLHCFSSVRRRGAWTKEGQGKWRYNMVKPRRIVVKQKNGGFTVSPYIHPLVYKCIRQWSSFRRGWRYRGSLMILKMANRQCCWRFLHCFIRSWNKCNLKLMLNVCLCSLLCTLDRTCWNDLCLEWRLGIFVFYQCHIEWWLCIPEGIPMASIKSVTCPSDLLYFCVDKLLYVSFWFENCPRSHCWLYTYFISQISIGDLTQL